MLDLVKCRGNWQDGETAEDSSETKGRKGETRHGKRRSNIKPLREGNVSALWCGQGAIVKLNAPSCEEEAGMCVLGLGWWTGI